MIHENTVRAVGTLSDGCQVVVLEHSPVEGRYCGMLVPAADGEVRPGDSLVCEIDDDGEPFDGKSTVAFRYGDNPWIECKASEDVCHHPDYETLPVVRRLVGHSLHPAPHRCEVCGFPIAHPGTCADCELSLADAASWRSQNERRARGIDVTNMKGR